MSTFQIIVLGIFGTLILVGVGVFATLGGLGGGGSAGNVTIWGTIDEQVMGTLITNAKRKDDAFAGVTYVYVAPAEYNTKLLNSMASGGSPDLFLVSLSDLQSFSDKVYPIPYRAVSQSSFINAFIDGAQQFLTPQGALALPFSVDPLVMYWNRDLFASAGVATPPVYWNDFLDLAPKITSLDSRSTLKQSAVALGEWRNVEHAKEILSLLFMQSGDNIVARAANGTPVSVFTKGTGNSPSTAAESALRFYTEFANPSKTSYSWNRSLARSRDAFAAGDLAVYFGFVSEGPSFATRNPNLRYAVAAVPQIEGNVTKYTYGAMSGFAISLTSHNPTGALIVAQKLTSQSFISAAALATSLPPVRRDVQFDTSANAAAAVAGQAALISRGLLDPNPQETNAIFQDMIESVVSGQRTPSEAVKNASAELVGLMPKTF